MTTEGNRRSVRSFVLRSGRITVAQERALAEFGSRYVIDSSTALDLDVIFGRRAPRVIEIGFGHGENLLALAAKAPEQDFLGIEVHRPGVGKLLLEAAALGLGNLRVISRDAVEVLNEQLADACCDELLIFFPDPWPKKRHHKRRLVQAAFCELAARKLRPGGVLRLATDWQDYAQQMLETLRQCTALENLDADGGFCARPANRPPTHFERRGARLGHSVWDLAFRRRA
ncbi:MAG TPA: tRNA (guanosine(46)-N7)-methyltransferase TrmB [Steroidobacteraceae bacterium]|nr:tRNA (guanosine(46)-N7)-methyltransferase TrmB [Steroidobacteraceae bacterium]